MKKFLFTLAISLYSLTSYATAPSIDLDGLSVINLNLISSNSLQIYGHTSGAASAGICRIILRSNDQIDGYYKLTERFNFIHGMFGADTGAVTPKMFSYAAMFELMSTDYGFEYVRIETKDGRSIGQNMVELFGGQEIAAMAGTCVPQSIAQPHQSSQILNRS